MEYIDHIQLAMPAGEEAAARCNACALGVDTNFRAAKKAHPAFRVSDLAGLVQQLQKAGLAVKDDGNLPGFHRIYVDDPFGNRLEFMETKPSA